MFKEEFISCGICMKVTKWAFVETGRGIEGECETCGNEELFEDWDEVMNYVAE